MSLLEDEQQHTSLLRQSEARFRELAETIDEAFWITDPTKQKILYISPAYATIWQRTCASLYASPRNWLEAIHPDDQQRIEAAANRQADEKYDETYRILRPDGSVRWIHDRAFMVREPDGQTVRIVGTAKDITDSKNLEAQYLRAQRMESIGTLAGGIAHDINNALAPILMSIELLKMWEQDARCLDLLDTIESSAKRGADMVEQLLSYARGVEGQRLQVRTAQLLRKIEKIANETFLKNIQVRCEVPSNLWMVTGDPTQLQQVMINLCINARDAMPNGGILTLAASNFIFDAHDAGMNLEAHPGPYVRIVVGDSGTGMLPKVLERIFEPFFTTKEVGSGTGLGLPTSMGIIKSHGGFIRVESNVGTGTEFEVFLPAQTESESEDVKAAPNVHPRGNGELVLVIDDETAVREITRQTLEAFGYKVVTASDGLEGTAIYADRQHEIDLVLTDMMMPVMDGPTTIRVLLQINPRVLIVAASGLNSNNMMAMTYSADVKHFITKPYTAETLLKVLHQLLEK